MSINPNNITGSAAVPAKGRGRKRYYFPNKEHIDKWFIDEPICIDETEVSRLISEWADDETSPDDLWNQLHEATEREISQYGVYDSDNN